VTIPRAVSKASCQEVPSGGVVMSTGPVSQRVPFGDNPHLPADVGSGLRVLFGEEVEARVEGGGIELEMPASDVAVFAVD